MEGDPNFLIPPPKPSTARDGPGVLPFISNDYILKYFNVKRTVQQCRGSGKNFGSKFELYVFNII
jgi:hypothetical protein